MNTPSHCSMVVASALGDSVATVCGGHLSVQSLASPGTRVDLDFVADASTHLGISQQLGCVFVAEYRRELTCFDAQTGARRWTARIPCERLSTTLVGGDRLLVSPHKGRSVVMNLHDGTVVGPAPSSCRAAGHPRHREWVSVVERRGSQDLVLRHLDREEVIAAATDMRDISCCCWNEAGLCLAAPSDPVLRFFDARLKELWRFQGPAEHTVMCVSWVDDWFFAQWQNNATGECVVGRGTVASTKCTTSAAPRMAICHEVGDCGQAAVGTSGWWNTRSMEWHPRDWGRQDGVPL